MDYVQTKVFQSVKKYYWFSNSGKSTSSEVPEEIQREMGLSEGLVRFSVGLDNDIENTWQKIKGCLDQM